MQTASGECAHYIDVSQFRAGESPDKCGPFAVEQFWHSTRPDADNTYTPDQIHNGASSLYTRFIGPDQANDHNGTSNQTLYAMLEFVGFKDRYVVLPNKARLISAWLAAGYAIIVGFAEASAFDTELGRNPYQDWNPAGLFHIINLTGIDSSGNWLVRDTANIDSNGEIRPGPRHYKPTLSLTSATLVAPSWMAVPTSSTPPAGAAPPPTNGQLQQAKDVWISTAHLFGGNPPDAATGIASAWFAQYGKGQDLGAPLTGEMDTVDWDGNKIKRQAFAGGVWIEWYDVPGGGHQPGEHHAYTLNSRLF